MRFVPHRILLAFRVGTNNVPTLRRLLNCDIRNPYITVFREFEVKPRIDFAQPTYNRSSSLTLVTEICGCLCFATFLKALPAPVPVCP